MAKSSKRKVRKNVVRGMVHIKATFNNTLITISDMDGGVICQDSGGSVGFKGSRKSTPFAAQRAAEKCARTAMRSASPFTVITWSIQQAGLRIASIEDVTPIPHNGCRPRKRRRV